MSDTSMIQKILIFTSFVSYVTGGLSFCHTNDADPCVLANSSTMYQAYMRSESCAYNQDILACDRYIEPKWYRVDEPIIDYCPGTFKCGAVFPLWLNGSLPTTPGETVTRQICKAGLLECCESQYEIQIKNCDSFNAYCLSPTDGCPERYCFGTNGSCEAPTTPPPPSTTTTDYMTGTFCAPDPCVEENVFDLPEQTFRSENCVYSSKHESCDRYLEPKWYKVKYPILNHCPRILSCGAVYPIWLNGSLPTELDGVVSRKACKSGLRDCCDKTYDIKVKNCNNKYFAYCLSALDGCSERYCFGENETCFYPTTYTASTGLPPDTRLLIMSSKDNNIVPIAISVSMSIVVISICLLIVTKYLKSKKNCHIGDQTTTLAEKGTSVFMCEGREIIKAFQHDVKIPDTHFKCSAP